MPASGKRSGDIRRLLAVALAALMLIALPIVEDGCDPGGPTWPPDPGELR